jgi:hypothetical protein
MLYVVNARGEVFFSAMKVLIFQAFLKRIILKLNMGRAHEGRYKVQLSNSIGRKRVDLFMRRFYVLWNSFLNE